ncbi:MFS transporter [Cuniculiplasma divulgatum]|uniref:DHA1 family major facilitator superfamily permease n=1 Tax=Cuniculiplasma divulgatum TaxID=1673428 RepID=A0A1N5VJ49_9ARCH|nr:MFS transporter [Cuniculiplasma divulgatum]SIM73102.1 DHA1 family major facilitator superfamily permease [Cuniculiplasma divulgatum]SJK85200.1 DHA1 family major facilitator superfamily permease [Cuniculiplasma divulgatum]
MDNVKIVTVSSAIRGLGYSSIWIYSSIYMTKFLGLSTFFAALVFMSGGIVSSFAQYGGGRLGDRIGHKKVFTIFLSAVFLMSLILAVSKFINGSTILFPLSFGAIMVLNGFQSPSSNALVSRSSNVQLKGFSIMRVGNNLGWGFGPAMGGFILSYFGFPGIFYFFTVTALISFLISLKVRNIPLNIEEKHLKFNTSNLALIVISVSALLIFMVQAQETISLSLYSDGIFSGQYYEIGLVYMLNGLLVAFTQPFFYKISRKMGEFQALILGGLIYTLGFASYGLDSNLIQMLVSTAVFTMGENLSFPNGYSIVASISRKEKIGTNIGIYNAFCSAGRAFGPLLGGAFLPVISSHILFWIYVTFPGFIATVLLIFFYRTIKNYRERFSKSIS